MGGSYSPPPQPEVKTPDPLPPPSERTSAEIASAAEAQRRKYAGASPGRAATMLTGGMGVTQGANSAVALLGGAGRG